MPRGKKSKVVLADSLLEPEGSILTFEADRPEVKIVKPRMEKFPPMYKDAGAGRKKFFKVVAVRDSDEKCFLRVKSGVIGHPIQVKNKESKDFQSACEEAQKMIGEKLTRGYKVI